MGVYVGSIFGYREEGYDYNITFRCLEKIEPETGLKFSSVTDISVTDRVGIDAKEFVDMKRIESLCDIKAIEALSYPSPPEFK